MFAGGWTLQAAEAVCSGGAIEEDEVLDLLGALVDKSLVVAGAAAGGAVRYRMLEPIRQYAREKLEESGEAAEVQGRHAAFSSPWQKKPSRSWLDRSRARGWSVWRRSTTTSGRHSRGSERGQGDLGLRFGGALWRFWLLEAT